MNNILNVFYVVSVALQMAAAIMLLLGTISKRQVKEYIKRSNRGQIIVGTKESTDKMVEEKINGERQQNSERYQTMHMNRFAAGYLFIGYLIGIWGENNTSYRWQETAISILLFIFFIMVALLVSNKYASGEVDESAESEDSLLCEVLETEDMEE